MPPKIPNLEEWDKSQPGNLKKILPQSNSQTMVASEKTFTNPTQDYFNSVFKSKIYFWYHLRACATKQGSEARTTWTNSSERKSELVEDHDQQHRTTLKIERKADRTALDG